jgi:hypothetical protein
MWTLRLKQWWCGWRYGHEYRLMWEGWEVCKRCGRTKEDV